MTTRAAAAERTREALLEAGLEIAGRHGLAAMSVNRVVATAGVAKGTFYVHFPDRGAFLGAMHERFHAQVAAAVGEAMAALPPGRERLRRGLATYLDLCLRHNGVKALLLEARNDPALADQVAMRADTFVARAEPDLRAMGWPDAASAARLVVAMSAELSVGETAGGAEDTAGRATLWTFLDRLDLGLTSAPDRRA